MYQKLIFYIRYNFKIFSIICPTKCNYPNEKYKNMRKYIKICNKILYYYITIITTFKNNKIYLL